MGRGKDKKNGESHQTTSQGGKSGSRQRSQSKSEKEAEKKCQPGDSRLSPPQGGVPGSLHKKTSSESGKEATKKYQPGDSRRIPSHVVTPSSRQSKSQSESEKEVPKVRMSQLADYEQEPKAAGASCMSPSKEEERLKEENCRLTQKVNELEREKAKLKVDIKTLSKTVDRSEEEKGELNCQIDDLKAKLQDSAGFELKDAAKGETVTNADTGDDGEVFHSLTAEGTEGTDGPPLAANVTATALPSDLQVLGRRAEQQHTHGHMKESELAAKAVKKQETIPREQDPVLVRKLVWSKEETPMSDERESEKRREAEGRARRLEAELNAVKKEKEDLERQVAEVHDQCEKAKRKVIVEAETDKNLLIEKVEHLSRTNDSLNAALSEKEKAMKQLQEDLRTTKGLSEAMNDTSGMEQGSAVGSERSRISAGEAERTVDSPSLKSCTLEKEQSDELKTIQKALEVSRKQEQKANEELTESAQQLQEERESQERTVRRLKQQHQDEVAALKAKVNDAEEIGRRWKSSSEAVLLAKEEELRQVKEKLRNSSQEMGNLQATSNELRSQITTLQTALAQAREEFAARKAHEAEVTSQFQKANKELAESAQQLQKERDSQEETVRRLKEQHQDKVAELTAKVKDAEDIERRWEANSQAVLHEKAEELKQANEKLHDASQEIGNLQATADGLRSQNTNLQTALAGAREENAARTEHEAKLTSQFKADVASRDANIRQLQEKCEQLEAQAMTYKLDFEQERSDRGRAMGRFDEERQTLQGSIEKLNEKMMTMHLEHDETLSQLEQLKELSLAQKEELRKKDDVLKHTSGSCAGLEQKLSKLNSKHETMIKENTTLKTRIQSQEKDIKAFRAIEAAYQRSFDEAKTYKELYHDAESKRSAAASRVTELTMVVNAMEEKGRSDTGENVEALRDEILRMRRHYDALEASCQRVTTEKHQLALSFQQLQRENEALKGRRIMTGEHEMSFAPRSAQGGAFLSFQGSIGAGGVLPKGSNDARGDVVGGHFAGDCVEKDSPPDSGVGKRGPSSLERISIAPTPLPRASQPEGSYTNAGRGMRPDSDSRKLAGYSASRVRPQPVVGMSQATAESHMQQTFSKHHVNVTPGQGYTYAPSGTAGKSSTDPCVQRQESSVSASTDSSLPQPLTQPGVVSALDDSLLSGFEADQRYIGEGINSEIRHEAHRYKKGEKGVVAVPAQADDQDWPLDPNLTCPYCKVVFRRGQMREYRYHVDDCQ